MEENSGTLDPLKMWFSLDFRDIQPVKHFSYISYLQYPLIIVIVIIRRKKSALFPKKLLTNFRDKVMYILGQIDIDKLFLDPKLQFLAAIVVLQKQIRKWLGVSAWVKRVLNIWHLIRFTPWICSTWVSRSLVSTTIWFFNFITSKLKHQVTYTNRPMSLKRQATNYFFKYAMLNLLLSSLVSTISI